MGAPHRDKETLEKKILTLLAENKMNVSEVARILCYHTNTIMYHIRQIHAATGKNPLNLFDLADLLGWIDVVRCKDCKSCLKESAMTFTRNGEHIILYHCDDLGRLVLANDYCSYGKRKDGEG